MCEPFVADWVRDRLTEIEQDPFPDCPAGMFPLVDIEVTDVGCVRVRGLWFVSPTMSIVVTNRYWHWVRRSLKTPISLRGDEGRETHLRWEGDPNSAVFNVVPDSPSEPVVSRR